MRRLSVLLTLLLVAGLLAVVGSHPVDAAGRHQKPRKKPTSVALRLAPARVTFFPNGTKEPTGLVAQVTPAKQGRVVTFQQQTGSTWRTLGKARTDASGRAYRPVTVATVGRWSYRVAVAGTTFFKPAVSSTRALTATAHTACSPATSPVGAHPSGEAYCLLARLDSWRASGVMGVGQQLNVSNDAFLAPLAGIRPNVIGFDLQELALGQTYGNPPLDDLLRLAHDGAVLTASWHATNPFHDPGTGYNTPPEDLAVLDPATTDRTPAEQVIFDRFWADWDSKLDLLARFESGDDDSDLRTAVVLRPLHEVNGRFFWWGQPNPTVYRHLWAEMQRLADVKLVRNILWAYSGNRDTTSTTNPGAYVPTKVDIGGLDTYDPETGKGNAADVLGLEGYAAIDQSPSVTRMALTEVGPHTSTDGTWNPAVISTTARKARISPLWAMLWFDDTGYAQAGRKQITSLRGGKAWLASCFNSLCYLR